MPRCGTDFRKGWRGRRRGCERERWFGMIARRSSGIAGVRGCAAPAHCRARLRVQKESSPAGHERELLPARGEKKHGGKPAVLFCFFRFEPNAAYSATGAPTGQTPAQAPHSMQVSALISYLPLPSEIADTGHSASQAPQLMQASVILYAMGNTPPFDATSLYQYAA